MTILSTIKNSFAETFGKFRKFWYVAVLLLLIQIAFFYSINSIQIFYWMKIMDNSQNVIDELASKDLSDENLAAALAQKQEIIDPYAIGEKAKQLYNDFFMMMFLSILSVLIFEGVMWAISDNLFRKKDFEKTAHYLGKFAMYTVFAVLLILIIFILASSLLFSNVTEGMPSFEGIFILLIVVFMVAGYFLVLAFSGISNTKIKEIFRKLKFMGFDKFLVTITLYLIVFLMIAATGGMIIIFVNMNIGLLAIAIFLFLLVFVFARILFISAAQELEKEFTRRLLEKK